METQELGTSPFQEFNNHNSEINQQIGSYCTYELKELHLDKIRLIEDKVKLLEDRIKQLTQN